MDVTILNCNRRPTVLRFLWFISLPPGGTAVFDTTDLFHILPNSLTTYHPNIRRYIVSATDVVGK